jgi:2'-5' RNA ligase
MTYRYYIGLLLPNEITAAITRLQQELFNPAEAIEPLEPHITLLPPPAVENIDPDAFAALAKQTAERLWPVSLRLTETVTFDSRAVAISIQSPALRELQLRLRDLLPAGTELTYYPHPEFIPHVTLAQAVRGKKLPEELIKEYIARSEALLPAECSVDHLTLFRWVAPRKYKTEII